MELTFDILYCDYFETCNSISNAMDDYSSFASFKNNPDLTSSIEGLDATVSGDLAMGAHEISMTISGDYEYTVFDLTS